ncbi:MAG TPA: hypothetical protein VG652_07730 [Gaiellaceae bacterium]|nr:hypothetical protein [Gaiellaceae bacterium]
MIENVAVILARADEGSVNIRAFDPKQPKSHEFIYGLTDPLLVTQHVTRLAETGLYTIVNETIDVGDGGVSGVSLGGLLEFAPGDTPRCVEKPGIASLPQALGLRLLETVYGFRPDLDYPDRLRTEFSIHPLRRGVRRSHTIIWEQEYVEGVTLEPSWVWPNRFSRHIGDKTFGLLIADALGLHVPLTTVVARNVAPFKFGRPTGINETWIRTAPAEQQPGRFTTRRGWVDPFLLLAEEDPDTSIAAILAQRGIEPLYSGAAAAATVAASALIEGVRGSGEAFMLGEIAPEPLPSEVVRDVRGVLTVALNQLGPVRIEWVHDGELAWIVQLHRGPIESRGRMIYPGTPVNEHIFEVDRGLESLRELVKDVQGSGDGIVLLGNIGITSHLGDVLRRARIPSRIQSPESSFVSDRLFRLA